MPGSVQWSEQDQALASLGPDAGVQPGSPRYREPWLGRLRFVVVPVLAVLSIAATIYLLVQNRLQKAMQGELR